MGIIQLSVSLEEIVGLRCGDRRTGHRNQGCQDDDESEYHQEFVTHLAILYLCGEPPDEMTVRAGRLRPCWQKSGC